MLHSVTFRIADVNGPILQVSAVCSPLREKPFWRFWTPLAS